MNGGTLCIHPFLYYAPANPNDGKRQVKRTQESYKRDTKHEETNSEPPRIRNPNGCFAVRAAIVTDCIEMRGFDGLDGGAVGSAPPGLMAAGPGLERATLRVAASGANDSRNLARCTAGMSEHVSSTSSNFSGESKRDRSACVCERGVCACASLQASALFLSA